MKINESAIASCVAIEIERMGQPSLALGTVIETGSYKDDKPVITVTITKDTYNELPDYLEARSVFIISDDDVALYFNAKVYRKCAGSPIFEIECDTENSLKNIRKEERFNINAGGLAIIEDKDRMLIPVKIKDISESGVGMYVDRNAEFEPGNLITFSIVEKIPEDIKRKIGQVDDLKAVVLRVQEADYGRFLVGCSLL